MITVSVKNLVEAICESEVFTIPEMDEGTSYLYKTVCLPMSKGHNVRLSELNFDAFEQEDIDTLNGLYSDVCERNHRAAVGISSVLQGLAPVCKAVGYV